MFGFTKIDIITFKIIPRKSCLSYFLAFQGRIVARPCDSLDPRQNMFLKVHFMVLLGNFQQKKSVDVYCILAYADVFTS